MLPKVATTILHSTSRAAAVVQNQSHAIRNVLQLQSSTPSGSAKNGPGSSNGGWGPSSGSSKHNTGSRFQSGFHGASRVASQVQTVTAPDTSTIQTDDSDEIVPVRVSTISAPRSSRLRSGSSPLAYVSAADQAEKVGVLQTVQLHHARSRHAFAAAPETPETPGSAVASRPDTPTAVRASSTLLEQSTSDSLDSPPTPTPASRSFSPGPSEDPATSQSTFPPQVDEDNLQSEDYHRLIQARDTKDADLAAEAVNHLRSISSNPTVREFNVALEALCETRRPGEPLTLILETYNDMLARDLLPNFRTYHTLLRILTERDHEVEWAIKGIEARRKWRNQLGDAHDAVDVERLEKLRAETNFNSAMSVFQAIVHLNGIDQVYDICLVGLLRSCVFHNNVDCAILVWSHIERRAELLPSSAMFRYLIQVFSNDGDAKPAQEIFKDFRSRCLQGKVAWDSDQAANAHLSIYNTMIEAYLNCGLPDMAITLLDEMIDTSSAPSAPTPDTHATTAPSAPFNPTRPPAPASSTFTTIISGFCKTNDLESAVIWFKRLLKQSYKASNPFQSTVLPSRPDLVAWRVMIENLSVNGKVDELNDLISTFNERNIEQTDDIKLRSLDRHFVQRANLDKVQKLLASSDASADDTISKAKGYLDFLVSQRMILPESPRDVDKCREVWEAYISLGHLEDAVALFEAFCAQQMKENNPFQHLYRNLASFREKLSENYQVSPPFATTLTLAHIASRVNAPMDPGASVTLLQSYALAKSASSSLTLSAEDWTVLLTNAVEVEVLDPRAVEKQVPSYAFQGLLNLLEDVPQDLSLPKDTVTNVINTAVLVHGLDVVRQLASKLNPLFLAKLSSQYSVEPTSTESSVVSESATSYPSPPSTAPTSPLTTEAARKYKSQFILDPRLTRDMEDHITKTLFRSDLKAVCETLKTLFYNNFRKRRVASSYIIGKMIGTLGRGGDAEGAKLVYSKMQDVLATMSDQPQEQAEAWFLIEDSMIIALAQAGDIDGAHVHRMRVLEQGGAPSADAYGGLILGVRDTTDDTSNAMALFQESQAHSVQPNQYLYNNIISKLAKARKADQALELFHQMRQNNVQPSSITYGALIGACARVGDADSAETLFREMTEQDNFKPRVPPYNTMMQLYTTTKPNRERSLYYYNQLLAAGVAPTSYTFKLLMETHVLEPIDIAKVESIFQSVVENPKIQLQGAHFATLINAHGCVLKNLEKAFSVFDSISSYKKAAPMDALVVESMTNVLVAHRRMDLLPDIIAKMNAAGVHMTAYIVNAIIRGHAVTGDLEKAREVFESLADPPTGVAGMHNHAPHDPSNAVHVSPMEPVYREPSTWEAMVRAELGAGNRDKATTLLERLKNRHYPEAVFNRISGVLVDHSMIPMI